MYRINKNIYMVCGAVNACIYNLNTKELLPIEHNQISMVQQVLLEPNHRNSVWSMLLDKQVVVDEEEYYQSRIISLNNCTIDTAWIEIITECNYRCIHCYVDGKTHEYQQSRMNLLDYKMAIDKIWKYGIRRIHIIGGEPMIHPDFWSMMEYSLKKFDFSVLLTNGSLLDKESIEHLKKLGLSEIDVSLYSTKEEEHEKVTKKKGSYKQIISIIKMIENSGMICHITTVRIPGVDVGMPYSSESKNPAIQHFDYMRASGRGASRWGKDKMLLENKKITSKISNRKIDPQKVLYKMRYHNCFGHYIRINPDLNVYPCTMEQRFMYGNIRENDLEEIVNDNIRTFNKDKVKECCVCEYRYICSDCRPDTFSEDICAKPWFCGYNPILGVWSE